MVQGANKTARPVPHAAPAACLLTGASFRKRYIPMTYGETRNAWSDLRPPAIVAGVPDSSEALSRNGKAEESFRSWALDLGSSPVDIRATSLNRSGGRVVMQRTANPRMPVRFRPGPPGFPSLQQRSKRHGPVPWRLSVCSGKMIRPRRLDQRPERHFPPRPVSLPALSGEVIPAPGTVCAGHGAARSHQVHRHCRTRRSQSPA
jgi:hypothetical protein